jgi:hypothetical protein
MFVKDYRARIPFGDGSEPPIMRRLRLGQSFSFPWGGTLVAKAGGNYPQLALIGLDPISHAPIPGWDGHWTQVGGAWQFCGSAVAQAAIAKVGATYAAMVTGLCAAAPGAATPTAPVAPAPSSTTGDQAQVVQLTVPSSAVPVSVQFQVTATVLNAGPAPWVGANTLQLAAPAGTPTQNAVAFATLPSGVAPGQQVQVVLTVQAPDVPGTYPYQYAVLNPSQQPITQPGTLTLTIAPASAVTPSGLVGSTVLTGDQAQVVQVTLPPSGVPVSVPFQVTVTVVNTGPAPWIGANTVVLAAPAGTPTQNAVATAALPTGVAPGQQVQVVLTVQAPDVPGTYPYQYVVINPAQQPIGPTTGTASLSVVPSTGMPAGYVTGYAASGYQTPYPAQAYPTAPPGYPTAPTMVATVGAAPTNWLLWGAGLLLAGGAAWYLSSGKSKPTRTRVVRTRPGGA